MKILFLSRWFPYPVDNGSKLRISNLLRGLAQSHQVTLLSFADQPQASLDTSILRSMCVDVHVVPWREYDPDSRISRLGLLSTRPRFLADTHSADMEALIRRLLSESKYDLVIASQLSMASYSASFGNVPAMFEEIELGLIHDTAARAGSLAKRLRSGLTWLKLRTYLSRLLESFCYCTVVSEQEHRLFTATFPEHEQKVRVLPNCINVKEYEGLDIPLVPNQLLFSGPFRYHANYEAMQWFISNVYPLIVKQVPGTRLIITGDHANLPLPHAPNVMLTGYIQDVKSLLASSWVSLAPLQSGGGTRLKILEAFAAGVPVVSTSKGAEGLDAKPGEHFLIADTPERFADQVIQVLQSRSLREQLSKKGKSLVTEKYDWAVTLPRFLQLVEDTARSN